MRSKEIEKTNAEHEASEGRVALWLSVQDLQWLSRHCSCTDTSSQEEKERCGRIRFRSSAALHKRSSLATDGKIKCGSCANFPDALIFGQVYNVIAEDLDKHQYKIKGSNGRTRWFPAYCFVPLAQPTPRLVSFEIDKVDEDQVNISLDDGTKRWLNLISLPHLTRILRSNPFFHNHATVVVEDKRKANIEGILNHLQDSGELLSATRLLSPTRV